jgi:hypothetical protein
MRPAWRSSARTEAAGILTDTPANAPGIVVATAGAFLLDALAHLAGLLDAP